MVHLASWIDMILDTFAMVLVSGLNVWVLFGKGSLHVHVCALFR